MSKDLLKEAIADAKAVKEKNSESIKLEEVLNSQKDRYVVKCMYFWCIWLYWIQTALFFR